MPQKIYAYFDSFKIRNCLMDLTNSFFRLSQNISEDKEFILEWSYL